MAKEGLKEFFRICYKKECNADQLKAFCDLINELNKKDVLAVLDFCSSKGTLEERLKIVAKKYKVDSEIIKATIKWVCVIMHHPARVHKIFG